MIRSRLLANGLAHLGWALMGQQCDCGHNHFNWLARRLENWANADHKWNDEMECSDPLVRWVGAFAYRLTEWSMVFEPGDRPEMRRIVDITPEEWSIDGAGDGGAREYPE